MIRYNKYRSHYLGYHKIQSYLSADKPHFRSTGVTGDFEANTEGRLPISGPTASVSAKASGSWNSKSVTALKEELNYIRAAAKRVSRKLLRGSTRVRNNTHFETRHWYTIKNLQGHYALRHHDDFRLNEPSDVKPRIAVWLIEIPDGTPLVGHEASVTWVLLTGTADQNHRDHQMGEALASSRAGSQTEELFEHLYASAYETTRDGFKGAFGQGFWRGNAARELMGAYDTTPERIEALFLCRKVLTDLHDQELGPTLSIHGWSAASTDKEVIVSKIILGTPLFVQRPRETPLLNRLTAWALGRL